MNSFKIIDVHTHIFPEKIAEKATNAIGQFYGIPMDSVGTLSNLTEHMRQNGICHSFILSTATVPQQVRAINDYQISVLKEYGDLFTAFGTVHADMEDILGESEYMRKNGIQGIKFHNDFQNFACNDRRLFPLYEKCQAEKIPVIWHAGDKRYRYTNPDQFADIAANFPHLIGICAHFGGYSQWDEALPLIKKTQFYVDTSSTLFEVTPERARAFSDVLGTDRIMYGTDFPMWKADTELEKVYAIGYSDRELEKVLYTNAVRFLGEANIQIKE